MNTFDFQTRYKLRPRVLRNVFSVDVSTTILDNKINFPICVSPMAAQRLVHPDGEKANARAAMEMGTCFGLSISASASLEEITSAAPEGLKFLQVDPLKELRILTSLIREGENKGFKGIILGADVAILRGRDTKEKTHPIFPPGMKMGIWEFLLAEYNKLMELEGRPSIVNMEYFRKEQPDSSRTWDLVQWLKNTTNLPIIIKGILTGEDARMAATLGVDAIIVSNHGGRQLEDAPATIDVLKEIVTAVEGQCEVYIDGGIRTGNDVFKALALGAKAVFIGRPMLWGIAYDGKDGAKKVLEILQKELKVTMALAGAPTIADIVEEMIVHESHFWAKN
ncbi:hypothetical protein CHS0354_035896 [Potamilus streckersoni]|uniref:(S)-2-hydroxy-acid oxidase n=1 Tax=Potamilus streckersoni TaxID=2493646 RepID=A0AAE0SR23_9BIVA|nr:hypothetical protein CHS0354_035896 [Potamilus streckersoni]